MSALAKLLCSGAPLREIPLCSLFHYKCFLRPIKGRSAFLRGSGESANIRAEAAPEMDVADGEGAEVTARNRGKHFVVSVNRIVPQHFRCLTSASMSFNAFLRAWQLPSLAFDG